MPLPPLFVHPERQILKLTGNDRHAFLQGLITNDIRKLTPSSPLYTAILTPNGRFEGDLFLFEKEEETYLAPQSTYYPHLAKKLSLLKLRADVKINEAPDLALYHLLPQGRPTQFPTLPLWPDPRIADLGHIGLLPATGLLPLQTADDERLRHAYRALRYTLGVAEGQEEITPQRAIILEYGFDAMKAIAWDKGCYLGQELMARTKHSGIIRKHIFPCENHDGPLNPDTSLFLGEQKVGTVKVAQDRKGLAMIRTQYIPLDALPLDLKSENGDLIKIDHPAWAPLS